MTNRELKKKLYQAQNEAYLLSHSDNQLNENQLSRKYNIPKNFRQYGKHYGGLDILGMIQIHKQAKALKCPLVETLCP